MFRISFAAVALVGVAAAATVALYAEKSAARTEESLAQATLPGAPTSDSPASSEQTPATPAADVQAPILKPASQPLRQIPRDSRASSAECAWVGKRTIQVLMRDDLIAADGFLKFYGAFGCSTKFLGEAFGCSLVETDGAPAREVEARIETCWKNPSAKATAQPQKPQPQQAAPKAAAPKPIDLEPDTAYPKP